MGDVPFPESNTGSEEIKDTQIDNVVASPEIEKIAIPEKGKTNTVEKNEEKVGIKKGAKILASSSNSNPISNTKKDQVTDPKSV